MRYESLWKGEGREKEEDLCAPQTEAALISPGCGCVADVVGFIPDGRCQNKLVKGLQPAGAPPRFEGEQHCEFVKSRHCNGSFSANIPFVC